MVPETSTSKGGSKVVLLLQCPSSKFQTAVRDSEAALDTPLVDHSATSELPYVVQI